MMRISRRSISRIPLSLILYLKGKHRCNAVNVCTQHLRGRLDAKHMPNHFEKGEFLLIYVQVHNLECVRPLRLLVHDPTESTIHKMRFKHVSHHPAFDVSIHPRRTMEAWRDVHLDQPRFELPIEHDVEPEEFVDTRALLAV